MKFYSRAISTTRARHRRWLKKGPPDDPKREVKGREFQPFTVEDITPGYDRTQYQACACDACRGKR